MTKSSSKSATKSKIWSEGRLVSLVGARRERVLASKRYRDGGFHNTAPVSAGVSGNPLPVMGEFFWGGQHRVPREPLPILDPRATWRTPPSSGLRATWLGHSAVLLEVAGHRVLTDPVFGERASPLHCAGPKRFQPPPVPLTALPPLDVVLISHDHYDHLCHETVLTLARTSPAAIFVTSLGVGARLESWGIPAARIVDLDWWESYELPGRSLRLTATPAQHFSGRGVGDRNHTLWSSWVVAADDGGGAGGERRVFFSGDTGLTSEFLEVARLHGPFDLVLLEIGAWHPSWGGIHLGPANALKAFEMLGGGTLLPVHWGTFNLAMHAWNEPAEELWHLGQAVGARLLLPKLGGCVEPAHVDVPQPWWRR